MVGTTGITGVTGTTETAADAAQAGPQLRLQYSQQAKIPAVDATQDGTEQEQHGQQEDAAATVLLALHTDADAAVTKQFVF